MMFGGPTALWIWAFQTLALLCVLSPSISQHSLLPPFLPPSLQCVMGHDDVAAWLLARGASVDLVDSRGRSALFYASKIGSVRKEGEEGGEGSVRGIFESLCERQTRPVAGEGRDGKRLRD